MGCLRAFALYRLLGIHSSLAGHRTLSTPSPIENQWPKLNTASPSVSGKWRNAGGRKKSVSVDEVAIVASRRRTSRPIRSYLTLSRYVAYRSRLAGMVHPHNLTAFGRSLVKRSFSS